jgi:hypothetical protein
VPVDKRRRKRQVNYPLGDDYQAPLLAVTGPDDEGRYVLRLVGDDGAVSEAKTRRGDLAAALGYLAGRVKRG